VSPRAIAGGRYTLDTPIASGGMGEVWRATDTSLGRAVAIKLLRENLAADESFRARFASEAQHAASLHDPHIATVFDYGDDLDAATGRHTTYLVMELVDGKPLSELIGRPMAPEQAALLVAQAADGLAVAHAAGIVHRDVKPANFLVTRTGQLKITDFGIARARGAASVTDTGTIMGTPHYVAPEVAEGKEATPASDLYSLGVVLYEALTGTKPFQGETPIAVALAHLRDDPRPLPASVPAPLRGIVESTMAKDPAQRPPDAAALATALRRFAAGPDDQATTALAAAGVAGAAIGATQVMPSASPPSGTGPLTPTPAPGDGQRRRIGWLPVAAVVLAVLLLAGIVYAATHDGGGADQTAATTGPTSTPPAQRATTPTTPADTTPAETTPTTPTTSDTTTETPTFTVDPAAYIGRPYKDVEKELKDAGLVPVRGDDVAGGEKDTVADISPTGDVPVGQEVTLAVYTGDESGPGNADKHGHGPKAPKEN
jgi:serine/threonine-protein kinase